LTQGEIILTTMPQSFRPNGLCEHIPEVLYYNHALRRFDKSMVNRAKDNLLIPWADEAQRFMTARRRNERLQLVDVIRSRVQPWSPPRKARLRLFRRSATTNQKS